MAQTEAGSAAQHRIAIYTNGDYLTPGYVEDLAEAGLDYLHEPST